MRYSLEGSTRRLDGGSILIGGSPLTLMQVSAPGVAALDRALATGGDGLDSSTVRLIDRLVDAGMIVPQPDAVDHAAGAAVTVVIPVRDGAEALDRTLSSIQRASVAPFGVVIVDDASLDPESIAVVARRHGARLEVRDGNGGPAAARNVGLAVVTTALVAFVDADVEVDERWLETSLAFFDDDAVGAVAPRVRSIGGGGHLDRYERYRSPLDLGSRPGPVRRRSRLGYVPSAALIGRVAVLRAVDGFDEELRFGEDVDLVWRLAEIGCRVWYCGDRSVVRHHPRADLSSWLRQRFDYGTSAASLDERHRGAVAPLGGSRWSVLVWGLVALGHPVVAGAVAGGTVVALARKLSLLDHPMAESVRLAGRGHLGGGEAIARALVRPWFPLTLAAAFVSRRARRVAVAAALGPAVLDWRRRRPSLGPVTWVALSVADDVAYSVGVWSGCLPSGAHRRGRWGALRPDFVEWPG